MQEDKYQKFCKRYDKFRNNNLPTPFWDEERQVLEYVYFNNKKDLVVNNTISSALETIASVGFYYPFTDNHMTWQKDEKGKIIKKFVVSHTHAHTFEEVVRSLYFSPETFKISKDEEQYYSNQELEYLKKLQKYLQFIGMKDLKETKIPSKRFKNKIHSKYENALIYQYSDFVLNKIKEGKRDFRMIKWYPEYRGPKVYKKKEYQALITNKENDFIMFVEFINEEIKLYKDVKKLCDKENILADDDKVIIIHFKILEEFN